MEIALKDSTKKTSLVKVLVHINRNRKTGTLSLTTPLWTKKMYINTGDVIFSSSSYEDDRLGEMLLKAGKITVEQYDKSVEVLKATGKRQGAILVELGYLTPKDLFWGVKYQVKEIIQSMFLAEDAQYEFSEDEVPSQEVITLKMSMGNLIYDSVRRIDSWTRIRNEMPDMSSVLRLSDDPLKLFQDIELTAQDKKILSLIDGRKTISEVIENSWMGSFEALKILYVLWSIGIFEIGELPTEKGPDISMAEEQDVSLSINEILQPNADEDEELLAKVSSLYEKLGKISSEELLGIDRNTDAELLKKTYYRLAKEYHPDRYFSVKDDTVKTKLAAIFDAITKAYNELRELRALAAKTKTPAAKPKSPAAKAKAPAAKAKAPAAKATATDSGEAAKAEEQFRRGVEEFKRSNYWGAADNFRWAAKLVPDSGNYWNYLSLALSKIPGRLKDAEEALLTAIRLEPRNADFEANLGLIYLKAGMKKRAAGCFDKALTIDPGNEKASKGLQQTEQ